MASKNILIVCKAFYPENTPRSFRATELAKEFARQGHRVTVLTNEKDYNITEFLEENNIRLESFGRLKFRQLTKSKWPCIGDFKRKFGRLLFMLFSYPDIEISWRLKNYLKNINDYDLMISIAVPYPIHWGVAWARFKGHRIAKTWVADCGDPYFGNTLESFRIPFYFAYLEKWFSRETDFITIPFESLREKFFKEFHSKIRIIPQGFNLEEIHILKEEIHNDKPTFAYAGGVALRGIRSPIKFIEYIISLDREFEFHIFCSSGIDFLIPYASKSKGRIILYDNIPRNSLLPKLSTMDFLVNLLSENSLSVQIPSKLIDYALAGRPILNINPSEPDLSKINEFMNGKYTNAFQVPNIERYNIKSVTDQFLSLSDLD
jgi:hypothetical protein